MSDNPGARFRLTFVINTAAFLVSHRLALAVSLRDRGTEVKLVTGQAGSAGPEEEAERTLAAQRIDHQRVAFGTSTVNPLVESRGLLQLVRLLRRQRPDIVHCASPKGVLYGGLAARLAGVPALVLAISGMGYAFTKTSKRSFARNSISVVYRRLARLAFGHPNKCVIVQNQEDRQYLLDNRLASPEQICLIPGSGVHLPDFADMSPEAKQPMVLLPARILVDKGVREFVQAARRVRQHAPEWRFVLAGDGSYRNPSSVPLAEIQAWQTEGVVEWLGQVADMLPLYRQAGIVCLPSHREGMPKVLLEAAAAGCAIVTTDTVGCREAIIDGESGDLVPVQDPEKLAEALLALIRDQGRREAYGRAGQAMARERFRLETVIERTMAIYASLLSGAKAPTA